MAGKQPIYALLHAEFGARSHGGKIGDGLLSLPAPGSPS